MAYMEATRPSRRFKYCRSSGLSSAEIKGLDEKARQMGAESNPRTIKYIGDDHYTHIIVHNFWCPEDAALEDEQKVGDTEWSSFIYGAVASGRFVVTSDFILESHAAKYWKDELYYIPSSIMPLRRAFERKGKLFTDQNILILMDLDIEGNLSMLRQLQAIVRDGGGTVFPWTCRDLALKRSQETFKIDVIYTDMSRSIMRHVDFLDFVATTLISDLEVKIQSFKAIFEILKTYPNESKRREIDVAYDVQNREMMKKYHLHATKLSENFPFENFSPRSIPKENFTPLATTEQL